MRSLTSPGHTPGSGASQAPGRKEARTGGRGAKIGEREASHARVIRIGGDTTNIILMTDLDPQGPRVITLIEVVIGTEIGNPSGTIEGPDTETTEAAIEETEDTTGMRGDITRMTGDQDINMTIDTIDIEAGFYLGGL